MNKLYSLLAKSPIYVRRFGLFDGLRLQYQIEGIRQLPHESKKAKAYSIPGFVGPIHLRDCVGDHATFWQCLVQNQYDFSRFPQARRLTDKYDTLVKMGQTPLIIDCGGNIGLSALWFARKFPKAKIYVVEPDEANFELLGLNISMFGDRVTAIRGGVSNEPGNLTIVNPRSGPSAFRVQRTGATDLPDSIDCYTINQICELAEITDPMIVKIDIEGSQEHLFAGNTDWVNRADLITLELDDWQLPWQGTSRSFFSCLSQYPFDYLLSGESIFCFRDEGGQCKGP
jgi:FkbM family methyltransferase